MVEPVFRKRPGGFDILPASPDRFRAINDFIHVSEGLSNSYLITTDAGRIVINTGMGFEAPVHKRNYEAAGDGPTRYILLTQGHVDHVGGVDQFLEPGTEVIAQANNAAHQEDDARIASFRASRSAFAFAHAISSAIRYVRGHMDSPIPAQSRPVPTLTFEDHHQFELGGLKVELIATAGGETTDSMVVWLPQHRICFAGNLFSALFGHFPNLVTIRGDRYRDALRFIDSLDRVRELEPELLLVGHHQPVEGADVIRSELDRLRAAVSWVHDETVRGMNAGVDVHTLMREVVLPAELEVGEGYGKVSWSVRAIWESYAGWFHHRSTTELYGVPHWRVSPDFVELAGGAGPVAQRARQRLESHATLEAIHLAEAALEADEFHREALDVLIDAHQRLDRESENFWLSSWLRKQHAWYQERRASLDAPHDRTREDARS